ncbi:MAG: extracellular solute-binding protein, partial [Bdellovibrionia bacterium]
LSAAFAAKHPPDIAIMHQSALPNFVKQGLVIPLKDKLLLAGLPLNDLLPAAKEGVTFNNEIYALPFDFHALLWHLNLDLLTQAGLVDKEGNPMLPSNKQDLFAHARYVKERTGKRYLAIPSQTDPMPTWLFESWVWQQGAELFSADLQSALINSRAAQVSLQTLNGLYQNGYADPYQDYMGAEQTFLSGNSAILLNGTWVVNSYTNLAKKGQVNLKHYRAVSIPQLFQLKAAWTDSHIWVLPQKIETDPNKLAAAIAFLKFLFENNFEWAKTGHLPVRQSVLDSPEFQVLPSRKFYRDTAEMAHTFPFIENQQSIRDALSQHINATWLTPKNPEESLNQAQHQIQRILDEN